jgi:hypothetical protein
VLAPVPQPVLLFCDFHGHSRRRNVFTFGCHELAPEGQVPVPGESPSEAQAALNRGVTTRLFPKLLASRVDTFVLPDCSWRVQREKKNCARVAVWRDACLPASYTIEASFSGPDAGAMKGVHFTPRMFEDVGHAFCLALLDLLEGCSGARAAAALQALRPRDEAKGGGGGGGGGGGKKRAKARVEQDIPITFY